MINTFDHTVLGQKRVLRSWSGVLVEFQRRWLHSEATSSWANFFVRSDAINDVFNIIEVGG